MAAKENAGRWPVIDLLNEHGNETFKLPDLAAIVTALGDCVELVKEQNAINCLGVFEHMAKIAAGAAKEAAHDGSKVENEKRTLEFPR